MTPLEAIMWRVGQDPTLRMTVGALLLLDQPLKEAELLERVALATERTPRLQWRPDDATFTRVRPAWIEDDDGPDAEHHVRTIEVPAPGTLRQVLDLLELLEPVPFDPERSPWDVTLISGREGGKSALYLRAHHVLTDGLNSARLMADLFDRPDADPEPRPAQDTDHRAEEPPHADDVEAESQRRPGTVTIDFNRVLRPLSSGVSAARETQPLDTVLNGFQRALDLANSVSRQVLVTGGPLAPVPPTHSVLTHFDILSVANAREIALALGGGRTDVLVTAAAGALGLYHDRLGQPCPKVRVALPARTSHEGGVGGNRFAPTRIEIPTSVDHPGRQFAVVSERLTQARHEPALRLTTALASAVGLLPNRLLLPAVQAQADSIDLAVTAVPGLPADTRICGARVEVAYPMGPRLGAPLNITAFGNNGGLDVGITLDPVAITDPEGFRECLLEVFRALVPPTGPAVEVQ